MGVIGISLDFGVIKLAVHTGELIGVAACFPNQVLGNGLHINGVQGGLPDLQVGKGGLGIGAGKPQHIAVSCLLAHCFDTPGLLGEGSQQGIGHLGNGVELTLLKGGCHHGGVLYNVVLYTIQVRESLNPVVIIPGIYDLGVYLPALKNKGACSHRVYRSPVLSVLLYSNGGHHHADIAAEGMKELEIPLKKVDFDGIFIHHLEVGNVIRHRGISPLVNAALQVPAHRFRVKGRSIMKHYALLEVECIR